jgi:hypothetical protein
MTKGKAIFPALKPDFQLLKGFRIPKKLPKLLKNKVCFPYLCRPENWIGSSVG